MVDQDGNHYVKGPHTVLDPIKWSFDITFTGDGQTRTFSGTVVNSTGKIFEWKGSYLTLTSVSREGTNQRVIGSDGLSLDQLLQGVTSMSRQTKLDDKGRDQLVDLAQTEADRIFGRVSLSASASASAG